jgi:tRNA threonylcarbamoyladenosine modification (KEOPS) complex  Pcc1 subunit
MGIKKSELKQLQQTASNMVRTLTEMTSQTGELSKIATKLTERAETNQKKSSIKMAQEMNDVMIELSASQGIIGSALVKALNIK